MQMGKDDGSSVPLKSWLSPIGDRLKFKAKPKELASEASTEEMAAAEQTAAEPAAMEQPAAPEEEKKNLFGLFGGKKPAKEGMATEEARPSEATLAAEPAVAEQTAAEQAVAEVPEGEKKFLGLFGGRKTATEAAPYDSHEAGVEAAWQAWRDDASVVSAAAPVEEKKFLGLFGSKKPAQDAVEASEGASATWKPARLPGEMPGDDASVVDAATPPGEKKKFLGLFGSKKPAQEARAPDEMMPDDASVVSSAAAVAGVEDDPADSIASSTRKNRGFGVGGLFKGGQPKLSKLEMLPPEGRVCAHQPRAGSQTSTSHPLTVSASESGRWCCRKLYGLFGLSVVTCSSRSVTTPSAPRYPRRAQRRLPPSLRRHAARTRRIWRQSVGAMQSLSA